MSWQDYITNNLVGSGHVAKALICGTDGTWWAGSDDFAPSAAEIGKIIAGFDDSGAALRSGGLFICGQKYILLQSDEETLMAKLGSGGACCCKCASCVIVATYVEKMSPGNCNKATMALADYLRESGY